MIDLEAIVWLLIIDFVVESMTLELVKVKDAVAYELELKVSV
tara:strand:+ start:1137 stop:1262 length:126 start_codon:yes stop_codon:yes gene_type:complete